MHKSAHWIGKNNCDWLKIDYIIFMLIFCVSERSRSIKCFSSWKKNKRRLIAVQFNNHLWWLPNLDIELCLTYTRFTTTIRNMWDNCHYIIIIIIAIIIVVRMSLCVLSYFNTTQNNNILLLHSLTIWNIINSSIPIMLLQW